MLKASHFSDNFTPLISPPFFSQVVFENKWLVLVWYFIVLSFYAYFLYKIVDVSLIHVEKWGVNKYILRQNVIHKPIPTSLFLASCSEAL